MTRPLVSLKGVLMPKKPVQTGETAPAGGMGKESKPIISIKKTPIKIERPVQAPEDQLHAGMRRFAEEETMLQAGPQAAPRYPSGPEKSYLFEPPNGKRDKKLADELMRTFEEMDRPEGAFQVSSRRPGHITDEDYARCLFYGADANRPPRTRIDVSGARGRRLEKTRESWRILGKETMKEPRLPLQRDSDLVRFRVSISPRGAVAMPCPAPFKANGTKMQLEDAAKEQNYLRTNVAIATIPIGPAKNMKDTIDELIEQERQARKAALLNNVSEFWQIVSSMISKLKTPHAFSQDGVRKFRNDLAEVLSLFDALHGPGDTESSSAPKTAGKISSLDKDRRSRLARWLREVTKDVMKEKCTNLSPWGKITALLASLQLGEAHQIAIGERSLHLAALIAQGNTTEAIKRELREQVKVWSSLPENLFSRDLLAVYRLLSGDIKGHNALLKSSWRESFAMFLGFSAGVNDNVQRVVQSYKQELEEEEARKARDEAATGGGEGHDETILAEPVPIYQWRRDRVPPATSEELTLASEPEAVDVGFCLLSLVSDSSDSDAISRFILPESFTSYWNDWLVPWLLLRLHECLQKIGSFSGNSVPLPDSHHSAVVRLNFASNLEALGLWKQAVYALTSAVVPYSGLPKSLEYEMENIITRNITPSTTGMFGAQAFQLLQDAGAEHLLERCWAMRARKDGNHEAELKHLLEGGSIDSVLECCANRFLSTHWLCLFATNNLHLWIALQSLPTGPAVSRLSDNDKRKLDDLRRLFLRVKGKINDVRSSARAQCRSMCSTECVKLLNTQAFETVVAVALDWNELVSSDVHQSRSPQVQGLLKDARAAKDRLISIGDNVVPKQALMILDLIMKGCQLLETNISSSSTNI